MDYDQTREVLAAFEREGVDYVVFGGVAMNLQGLPRATEDLDDRWYRMKKDTVRPRDRADADRLRRRLDLEGE